MFSKRAFDTSAFGRQLEAALAYAQKTAVAERRTVSVTVNNTITPNTVAFTICPTFNPCGAPVALPLPTADGGAVLSTPSGVTIAPAAAFSFTPSGGASGAVTLTVTGDGSYVLFVEAGTGYVHR
jgi:MSHA pilin protein MshC